MMLQGNPFETELWVRERTDTVRKGFVQQTVPWATKFKQKVQAPQFPWMVQVRQRVRAWWLPVAFGLGTLLGLAVG
jgi:hypothetical protein